MQRHRALAPLARPFSLCLCCNLPLAPVERAEIAHLLPPSVYEQYERFVRCPGCERVFWPGSHYERMRLALRNPLLLQGSPPA